MPASGAVPALIPRTWFETATLVTGWLLRVALAVFFFTVGSRTFGAHSMWVPIFAQMGAPAWLRYLTSALQVVGAILLVIPRTFLIGALFIGCTMVGAILTWMVVLHEPQSAWVPAILLTLLIACVAQRLWLASAR
jgi:putative oxidoreductase